MMSSSLTEMLGTQTRGLIDYMFCMVSFSSDSSGQSAVQLTGDKRADADIKAFIKARQKLLQSKG